MPFDHTAAYRNFETYPMSQLGEGGHNAIYNCVVTTFSDVMQVLGYPDVKPQDWTDWEYGPTHFGDTFYNDAIRYVNNHAGIFPSPPQITITNPNDTIAALDAAGSQGFPVSCNFYIDANIIPASHPTQLLHVSPVIRVGGGHVTILNVWHGEEQSYPFDYFRAATHGDIVGWIATFHRAIPAHHFDRVLHGAHQGAQHGAIKYTVRPGDTLGEIAAAHHMMLAKLLAANPHITNGDLISVGEVITIPV